MNEHLRNRIQRRLEALSDDRGYQILDFVEFLETKYADRSAPSAAASASNPFARFTEAVEDRLRAGKVSASTIAETVGLMNKATSVLNSALAATKSMATEFATVSDQMRQTGTGSGPSHASGTKPASAGSAGASSPAHDIRQPGSGEEKL